MIKLILCLFLVVTMENIQFKIEHLINKDVQMLKIPKQEVFLWNKSKMFKDSYLLKVMPKAWN